MRTTAILNLKGGVGKTTSVINTAAILADDYHKRVLVIDADSQSNTTEFFGGSSAGFCTLSDMLRRVDVYHRLTQPTNHHDIDLIAADDSLMDLDLSKAEDGKADVKCLQHIKPRLAETYDYVIIDCPPAFTAATAAALLMADDVIIPIKLDAFALRGMANLMRQVENMKRLNRRLRVSGVLPVMYYAEESIRKAEEMIAQRLPVYHYIRRSPTVDRMTYAQQPLTMSSRNSGALRDYRKFVGEYVMEVDENV